LSQNVSQQDKVASVAGLASTYSSVNASDLDQIQEIFPNANPSRSRYLLTQNSLSNVLMILASENSS